MNKISITLAGCPNCGKSALFNALTGSHQKVGNYPGVTVEKKQGVISFNADLSAELTDLPGIYSLFPHSQDEKIAVKYLTEQKKSFVVGVIDATDLERTLGLILDLKERKQLDAVVLNMMDLATKQGLLLDFEAFSKAIGVPVLQTSATKNEGVKELKHFLETHAVNTKNHEDLKAPDGYSYDSQYLKARSIKVKSLLKTCVKRPLEEDKWTRRLDRVLLNRYLGFPILFLILLTMFQGVFTWAAPVMEAIEVLFQNLSSFLAELLPPHFLTDLLVYGIIPGVSAVLAFLPQILILFFFIFILEGSGYMMRAAFLMDRLMGLAGLPARAFVPLLSSFACAIPGIMGARTIKSERDRLITIMIAPLMTCSARLPVYVLLVGAFIPNVTVFGPLKMQGFVMFLLFLSGIVSAMIVGWVSKRLSSKRYKEPLIFDLPTYKWPSLKHVFIELWLRASMFIKKAGTRILSISVVIWFLASFPAPPKDADPSYPAIHYSFAGRIGSLMEPVLAPVGFDWRIAASLIPGFAAREVMISALGTVFAVEDAEESEVGIRTLQQKIASTWTVPTGLALIAWYVFSPQCLATLAVLRRESQSLKFTLFTFGYLLILAYLAAFITFRISSYFYS